MSKGLLLLSLNCGEIHVTAVLIFVAVMFWSGGQYTTSGPELSANKMSSYKRVVQIFVINKNMRLIWRLRLDTNAYLGTYGPFPTRKLRFMSGQDNANPVL